MTSSSNPTTDNVPPNDAESKSKSDPNVRFPAGATPPPGGGSAAGTAPGVAPDLDGSTSTAVAQSPPPKKHGGRGKPAKNAPGTKRTSKRTPKNGKQTADHATSAADAPTAPPPPAAPTAAAAPKIEPFVVGVRGKEYPSKHATWFRDDEPIKAFEKALNWADCVQGEPVIFWTGTDQLAALDIDWHHLPADKRPTDSQLSGFLSKLNVAPSYSWRTHGSGLRLIYEARYGLTAGEWAILAELAVRQRLIGSINPTPPSGIEIKSDTRHPLYKRGEQTCGPVSRHTQGGDLDRIVGALLGTAVGVEDGAADEWLEEKGMDRGRRYPHRMCPIDPSHVSKNDDPVVPLDGGVYCYSCAGRGMALPGMRSPGFAPYGRLVKPDEIIRRHNHLRNAVQNFAHWPHAEYLVEHLLRLRGKPAKDAYRALMKLFHVGKLSPFDDTDKKKVTLIDEQIERAFNGRPKLIRLDGYWAYKDNPSRVADQKGNAQAEFLPAARYIHVDDSDPTNVKVKLATSRQAQLDLTANGDLDEYGYPALDLLVGVDVGGVIGDDPDSKTIPALVPCDPPFKYRPKSSERELEMSRIEYEFPGVNVKLLKLLVAAKAFAQRGGSEPPRVLIVGMSQAAKTAHVRLAAELTGDSVEMLNIDEPEDRYKRAFGEGSRKCSYLLSDEIAKSDLEGKELCKRVTLITSDTLYHVLHKGHRKIGRLPVHVMCDTLVPEGLFADVQVTRRIVFVDLGAGIQTGVKPIDWRTTCGGGEIKGWRKNVWCGADAADAIVSEVKDELRWFGRITFRGEAMGFATFEEYAAHLGFPLLRDTDRGVDPEADAKAFFAAAIDHPDTTDKFYKGRGWKVFDRDGAEPVAEAWRALVGPSSDLQAATSRQWGRIIEVAGLELKVSTHGRRVGVRFAVGDVRAPDVKLNRDVLLAGHWALGEDASPADTIEFARPAEAKAEPRNLLGEVRLTDQGR